MGWGIYQLFTAADGEEVFVGITSNGHWERFCKEFALGDLLADSRLDDNAKRVAARGWLPARIAEEMRRYPSAELAERLTRARVPYAPLRRPDQLVDDPHLNAAEQWIDTPLPGRGTAKLPKLPVRSTAFEMGLRRPAPRHRFQPWPSAGKGGYPQGGWITRTVPPGGAPVAGTRLPHPRSHRPSSRDRGDG